MQQGRCSRKALTLGQWLGLLMVAIGWLVMPVSAIAAPVPVAATEIHVSLGNAADELKFEPDQFEFEAGKRYKLVLTNPSHAKHYFTAKDFADGIWTQKVEAGKVEIKGAIHELELKPGATAEWVFIPLKAGNYSLRCSIPGHTEAGMKGTIAIASSGK